MPDSVSYNYSTGPAAIMIGTSYVSKVRRNDPPLPGDVVVSNTNILGWCEKSPTIEVEGVVTPLFNTLGGVELPYAYFPQGARATITLVMTRWNDLLLHNLENTLRKTTVFRQSLFVYNSSISVAIVYTVHLATTSSIHRYADVFPLCKIEQIQRVDTGTMGEKVGVIFTAEPHHVRHRDDWSQRNLNNYQFGVDNDEHIPTLLSSLGEMSIGGAGALGYRLGGNVSVQDFIPQVFVDNTITFGDL